MPGGVLKASLAIPSNKLAQQNSSTATLCTNAGGPPYQWYNVVILDLAFTAAVQVLLNTFLI
jgi:hypothetical protein